MSAHHENGRALECVLVDLNTQHDFCDPDGAYPVVNASSVVRAARRIMDWARQNNAPVVSSLDSHRQWELNREGVTMHCIDGSTGQRKLDFTVLPNCMMVEGDNTLGVPADLFDRVQQVVFRKRTRDLLGNPKADRFLTQLTATDYILFGNGIENSVKYLALGLMTRNKNVSVVLDACGYWNAAESDLAARQTWAKGAKMITVDELTARRLRPRAVPEPARPRNGRAVAETVDRPIIPRGAQRSRPRRQADHARVSRRPN